MTREGYEAMRTRSRGGRGGGSQSPEARGVGDSMRRDLDDTRAAVDAVAQSPRFRQPQPEPEPEPAAVHKTLPQPEPEPEPELALELEQEMPEPEPEPNFDLVPASPSPSTRLSAQHSIPVRSFPRDASALLPSRVLIRAGCFSGPEHAAAAAGVVGPGPAQEPPPVAAQTVTGLADTGP